MAHTIDWEQKWVEETREHIKITGMEYWNKRAEDYTDMIRNSGYGNGEKIKALFHKLQLLHPDDAVLDIAAGPGSLTIPFAEAVRSVTVVEPSAEMIAYLLQGADQRNLANIEVIQEKWENFKINEYQFERKFDWVTMSNATLQFPDIGEQLMRINSVSKGYCCIADSISQSKALEELHRALHIDHTSSNQLMLLYNILYNRGILPNVHMIEGVMTRTGEAAITWLRLYLQKYRDVTEQDMQIIRDHVQANTADGMYRQESKIAAMWWAAV